MVFSRSDTRYWKSSCWLRRQAMQQPSFSIRQTGEHLACIPVTLKLRSSRVCCSPFGSPLSSFIFCGNPRYCGSGLFIRITVSFCFHCFPPFDLFILKAHNVSGSREAWANDWSKKNNTWHPGCTSSKMERALSTCLSNCVRSHHASPFTPGKMMHLASLIITPSWSWMMRQPFSSSTKSNTWMIWPQPFFISFCSSMHSLSQVLYQDVTSNYARIKPTKRSTCIPLCETNFHPGILGWFSSPPDSAGAQCVQTHHSPFQPILPCTSCTQQSKVRRSHSDTWPHLLAHGHPYRCPSSFESDPIPIWQANALLFCHVLAGTFGSTWVLAGFCGDRGVSKVTSVVSMRAFGPN